MKQIKLFLIFFIGLCLSACSTSDFICLSQDHSNGLRFSYTSNRLILNDIYEYYDHQIYIDVPFEIDMKNTPLKANMKPGSYYLKMDQEIIFLQELQEVVKVKMKPSPEKESKSKESLKDYKYKYLLKMRRYHLKFPTLTEYLFDKKSLQLTKSVALLRPAKSAIEQKFYPGENYVYPKKVRDLSLEEVNQFFPPSEPEKKTFQCEVESIGFLEKTMRFIASLFFYI